MAKNFDLSVVFKVLDKATQPVKKIGRSFKDLTKPVNAANKSFQEFGKTTKKIGQSMSSVGQSLSLKLTAPLTLMGGLASKAAIDFESAFTGVRKTVEATEPQFQKLKKDLMDLALLIPVSTTELFGVAEAAGQLGIKQQDIAKFTKVMADLGATTNLSADEAATELARFSNVVGVASEDFDKLGATIVDLGNNMAANEREIVEMAGRLKTAGKLAGLSAAEILGMAAALTSIGINAEAGGTAFSQVMLKISKEIGTGSKKMAGFAAVSGKTIADFEKLWKEDAAEALLLFTEGLKKVEDKGITAAQVLNDLGMDGIRMAQALLGAAESGDKFRDAIDRGNKAWIENTALTKEANLRYKTAASQLTIAKNRAVQMAAAFGSVLVPAILKVIKYLEPVVKFLTELSPKTKVVITVIGALVAAIGPLLIGLGALAASLSAIISSAPIIVGAFGAIVAAIGFFISPIGLVLAAFATLIVTIVTVFKTWDTIKTFWVDSFKSLIAAAVEFGNKIGAIFEGAFGVIGKVIGAMQIAGKSIFNLPSKIISSVTQSEPTINPAGAKGLVQSSSGINQSETDINIKVTADSGTSAAIEKVNSKKGDANVTAATLGYVGAYQ